MIKLNWAWYVLIGLFTGFTASEGAVQIYAAIVGLIVVIGILKDLIFYYKGVNYDSSS
jgi:hypothetical protein